MGTAVNILTFDVEEYFQVSGFADAVRGREEIFERRVVPQTLEVLSLLDAYGVRATFFVLGAAVERAPDLVRLIANRGHEIASHGWWHECLYRRTPKDFREDLRRSRRFLEDLCGVEVRGYRAPSFSITRRSLWALPILAEEGFGYDSSIVPIRHDRYGIPGARPHPFILSLPRGQRVVEAPPLTRATPVGRMAAGGGGWFRFFPLRWTLGALRRANAKGHPAVIYLHPWEIDLDQPRIPGTTRRARFRHFVGMAGARRKLERLLGSARFAPAAEVLGLATPARQAPSGWPAGSGDPRPRRCEGPRA